MSGATRTVVVVQSLEGCTAAKQGSSYQPDCELPIVTPAPHGGASAKSLYTTPQRQTFVGEAATPAGNYFSRDFLWEDLKDELESKGLLPDLTQEWGADVDGEKDVDCVVEQIDKGSWERFHRKDNATARFYKERRLVFLAQASLLLLPLLLLTLPPLSLTPPLPHMFMCEDHLASKFCHANALTCSTRLTCINTNASTLLSLGT